MTDRTSVMSGGCQCGAVRYALYAEPTNASICHCRMCQRATGGAFGAFTGIDESDFQWTQGRPATYKSSAVAERDFCGNCGTPLTYRFLAGSRINIAIGTFDEAARIPIGRQIGIESKLSWTDEIAYMPGKTTEEDSGAALVAQIEASRRQQVK